MNQPLISDDNSLVKVENNHENAPVKIEAEEKMEDEGVNNK